jgi:hypothetical protein
MPRSKSSDPDDKSTKTLMTEGKGAEKHKSAPDKKLKHLAKEMLEQQEGHQKPKR